MMSPGPAHWLVSKTQSWAAACCGQDLGHPEEVEECAFARAE